MKLQENGTVVKLKRVKFHLSPLSLELRWKRAEKLLINKLAVFSSWWIVAAAALLIIPPFYIPGGKFISTAGGMHVVFLGIKGALPATIVGSLILLFARPLQSYLRGLLFVGIWSYSVYRLGGRIYWTTSFFLLLISLPVVCLCAYLFLRYFKANSRYWRTQVFIYAAASLGFLFGISWYLYQHHLYYFLRMIWVMNPTFIVISAGALALVAGTRLEPQAFSFAFTNAIRGLPWPLEARLAESTREQKALWWQGFFNIVLGYLQIMLRIMIDLKMLNMVHHKFGRHLVFTFIYYILVLLTNVGYLNLLTGVLRISGWQVPDATDFKWLSKTPGEFWRRGNVYLYRYILRFIYFPLLRRLRRPALASSLSFVCLFFFKVGWVGLAAGALYLFGFHVPDGLTRAHQLVMMMSRWIFWVIALRISQRWWIIGRDRFHETSAAWISIGFNHLVMMLTYYLSFRFYAWWVRF